MPPLASMGWNYCPTICQRPSFILPVLWVPVCLRVEEKDITERPAKQPAQKHVDFILVGVSDIIASFSDNYLNPERFLGRRKLLENRSLI